MTVKAVAYRQLMHVVKQKGHLLTDWVVYPLVMVVSFGLLVSTLAPEQVGYVLLAAILWRVTATLQTSIVIGFMEDVWHETMRQTWALPIRLRDYVLGNMVFGAVSSLVTMGVTLCFAWALFGVTPVDLAGFVAAYAVLVAFGVAVGLFGMAALLRWGEGMQPMNWVVMDILVLGSGVFYPLDVLPLPVKFIAHFLPTTYVFLSMQGSDVLLAGAVLAVCYTAILWHWLKHELHKAKDEGKLVKFC